MYCWPIVVLVQDEFKTVACDDVLDQDGSLRRQNDDVVMIILCDDAPSAIYLIIIITQRMHKSFHTLLYYL